MLPLSEPFQVDLIGGPLDGASFVLPPEEAREIIEFNGQWSELRDGYMTTYHDTLIYRYIGHGAYLFERRITK